MSHPLELTANDVYLCCDLSEVEFKTTDDLIACAEYIGQQRALKAIDLGIAINQPGYNLFLSGPPGVGKTTSIKAILSQVSKTKPAPEDWCYVYNFEEPNIPRAIRLPTGKGRVLQRDMNGLIETLLREIPRAFESKEYEEERQKILNTYQGFKNELSEELQKKAQEEQFQVQHSPAGMVTIPLVNGKPVNQEDYAKLTEEEKEDIKLRKQKVDQDVAAIFKRVRKLDKEASDKVKELDTRVASFVVNDLIEAIEEKHRDHFEVPDYLGKVQQHIIENIDKFRPVPEMGGALPMMPFQPQMPKPKYTEYRVNVFIDNSHTKGAPVVFEQHPIYLNLFGAIEREAQMGVLTTDFTMIRPGSLAKANGGYLVVEALDVLRSPFVWDYMKKVLMNQELGVEDVYQQYGLVNVTGLRPEPIKVDLKVIMIGNPFVYGILYQNDEDFRKLFKVKADFDFVVNRTEEKINQYACFIKSICDQFKLSAFTKGGVEAVIEYSSRLAGDKKKLSVQYGALLKVVIEADYWRGATNESEIVTREHVEKAVEEKLYRSRMIEDKIQELIAEGAIIIESEGARVGQINGLSVLHMGDFEFGRPSRITCETFMGAEGVVNIERKAKMSGSIHDKGVLILSGYLGAKYAQNRPLSLSASMAFEQSYGMIDGDSASAAELVVLLSALSGVPIRQDLAITGSIDQKGNIQPIGGANEKIEGFYRVCRTGGLSGTQGIVMPRQNVTNLMLHKDVVESIEKGEFHIYAVETIEEVIGIMMDKEAGERDKKGKFPKGSVNYLVDNRLQKLAVDLKGFAVNAKTAATKGGKKGDEEEEQNS